MTATLYANTTELEAFMALDSATSPFTTSLLQEALDRAADEIDERTGTCFTVKDTATPLYTQVTNEKHPGKGRYDRNYFLWKYPLPDVSTAIASTAVNASDSTIFVTSTTGFLTTGYIGIESDKIAYTGKSATSFTGCTGVGSSHAIAKLVKPYVVEISTTASGSTPAWTILTEDTEFDIDLTTAKVHVFRDDFVLDVFSTTNPPRMVPNRFRVTYVYGYNSIPRDVNRLCLMIAAKDLMHTVVRKASGMGMDNFSPDMIDVDEKWIDETIRQYKSLKMANI